jgi:hypothetical protein
MSRIATITNETSTPEQKSLLVNIQSQLGGRA